MKKVLLLLILVIPFTLAAQPPNDDCSGAQYIGTLGAPGACGAGIINGTTTTVGGTLVGATPEVPYSTLVGCGMASPANSVWYTFTAPVNGFAVVISITGATFTNPNIALYNGSACAGLAGVGCIVGAGGTATLNINNGIVPGNTYTVFISGNTGQSGTFTLNAYAYQDCSNCLNASSLTVSPLPVGGNYQPGQTVHFCYHIDQYTQITNNWLHGIQMSFGAGWNAASLVTYPPPTVLTGSCGSWGYYPAGVISTANGTAWPAGFYFDEDYDFLGFCYTDGDPGDNYGDGLSCANCFYNPLASEWDFCWDITVQNGCNPGMSLAVIVNTSGDGESGSWTSVGCASDGSTMFNAMIACCPPTMAMTSTCTGATTGTATATPVGATGPYTYDWQLGGQTTQTATGLSPGTYTVTVTDANLCAATSTVTVTALAAPTVNPIANITACAGANVVLPAFASVPAGATFAWTNTNTAIGLAANGAGNIPNFTAVNGTGAPITATISVTATLGCVGAAMNFTITINPIPVIVVNSPTICAGQTANLVAGGGASYTWTAGVTVTGVGTGDASPAATSTYTVTGTTAGCSSTAIATVTVAAGLNVTVNSPTICPGGTANLLANGATTYAWTAGAVVTGVNTADATPAVTTTYTVTGTTGGCTGTAVATVTVAAALGVTVNSPTICSGQTATLTANGATTYAWTAGATSTGVNTADASPLVTTTYTVTGTTGGCTGTAIATVTVDLTPNVTVNSPTICTAQTANLTANGATSYVWTAGVTVTGVNTGDATPAVTTSYTVTGTTAGCSATAVATVTVAPNLNVIVNSPTICAGGTANLIANGATTYAWTAGATSTGVNTADATPAITTSYTVTGTTGTCTGTATATVTVDPLPTAIVPANIVVCAGINVPASAFTSNLVGATFGWVNNNPAIGLGANGIGNVPTFVTTNAGATAITANITVTAVGPAPSFCIGLPAIYTITVNPAPVAPTVVSPVTYCQNDVAVALNAVGVGLLWYTVAIGGVGNAIAPTPSTAVAGTTSYYVSQTVAGCEGPRAQIDVVVNPTPALPTVTSPVNYCLNDIAVALTATGSNLLWYTVAVGGVGSAVAPIPSTAVAGTTSYFVSQTLLGCEGPRAQIDVITTALPVVGVTSPTICNGATATMTANGGTTYTWSAGATSSGVTTATASPIVTTTYTVTGTTAGCSNTAISTVTVNPIPVITVNSPSICAGATANLTANGGTTYVWSAGATSTGVNTATATPAVLTTYTVTGTTLGCSSTAVAAVTVNALPTAIVTGGGTVCQGVVPPPVSIALTGTGPWSITYTDGTTSTTIASNVTPYFITNPSVGSYSVTAVSDANCSGTFLGSVNVIVNPLPTPLFTANPVSGCAPLCVTFTDLSTVTAPSNIAVWSWNFGDFTASGNQNDVHCYTASGTYSVLLTVTTNNNCASTLTLSNLITVYPTPTASFSAPAFTSVYTPDVQFVDHSTGATSWNWGFGDPFCTIAQNQSVVQNPIHTYSKTGTYCANLVVGNGTCFDSTQLCIVIEPEFTFYVPNCVSPNDDGINDYFYGKGENIIEYDMWIYDRWGNKIFHGESYNDWWDAKIHGNDVQEDVYVYVIKLKDFHGAYHKYIGSVTVVR